MALTQLYRERLQMDGSIRKDIPIPKYDENGDLVLPTPPETPNAPASELITDKQASEEQATQNKSQ